MSATSPKIIARNVAAIRRFGAHTGAPEVIAGNPAASRLESGVGNCYPGLECDLRNLERRFFPYLEFDIYRNYVILVSVDVDGVDRARAAGTITPEDASVYHDLAQNISSGNWVMVSRMSGTFGPLGQQAFNLDIDPTRAGPRTPGDLVDTSTGAGRRPSDAWTAVRLLTEDTDVSLSFWRPEAADRPTLTARRARYLDDNGALAAAFLPGELTQSLCSPWTHDFRDCGCYYWASNHPDIALPVLPTGSATNAAWQRDVPWQRRDRTVGTDPPQPATVADPTRVEMRHYEINNRWQELHFVMGRREIVAPYTPGAKATPLPLSDLATLITHLRYAAGVELAVAQEYLCAAYSLKSAASTEVNAIAGLRDDIRATRAELIRIAIGEMRHLRAVNDVLRGLMPPGAFEPALQIASRLPGANGQLRSVQMRAATRKAIADFIIIEAPSAGVDGLYGRILATLEKPPTDVASLASEEWMEAIRSIIAEGEDHYATFLAIQEWLAPYDEAVYLRSSTLARPPADNPAHQQLQAAYSAMLRNLLDGYRLGRFLGANQINAARSGMFGSTGLDSLADAVADDGFLVVFDTPADANFAPIDSPDP